MQDSGTTPLQSPGFLGALTTVHFVIIAILAVLAIIGILYGMKLSRERRAATRELEDAGHLERTGDAQSEPVAPPAPTRVEPVAPVVQEPVAPVVEEPVAQGMPEPVTTPLEQSVVPPEPPVVAAEPARAPFVETAAPVVPPTPAGTDLTRLKGLGPKVAAMLVEQGIPDIATLARLQPGEADAVAARLGTFAPRMAKDRWVEQARYLAAGDIAGFEAVFGKL